MTQNSSDVVACPCTSLAARWIELSEQISCCARLLRIQIAQHNGPAGVTEGEFSLLWACAVSPPGGMIQKDLAGLLAVSPAHVSGLVEQLRCKGLLRGRRVPEDRRRRHWEITPEGRAELHSVLVRLEAWAHRLDQCADGLPEQLVALIHRLASAVARDEGSSPAVDRRGTECRDGEKGSEAAAVPPPRITPRTGKREAA